MPIQIIDGFQVNTASPIDSRIVASGSAARNAIPYKYHGLRVFDISNNIPYVWNGSAWVSENSSGVSGFGSSLYFPIFNTSNTIMDSLLYQDGGIIKTADDGAGDGLIEISPYYGTIIASGGFQGDGYYLNNLRGDNINTGSIPINRLVNGSTGWILSGASGQPAYVNPNQITVGTSSVATQSTVTNTTSNTNNYVTFVSNTSGNNQIRVNSTGLLYNPATNVLTTGTVSANGIKFPSTQIPSTDVNTLDDYEEGTWTPGISGLVFPAPFTYTSAGWYTKIGRVIHISGYIKLISATTYTCPGTPRDYYIDLSSAPFSISNPSTAVGNWVINKTFGAASPHTRYFDPATSGAVIISNQIAGNSFSSRMYFISNGSNILDLPCSVAVNNSIISFSITVQNPL